MSVSPTVTIAIPAYNEAADIKNVISGFLSTNYRNLVEVFVADGGSTDNTRDIIHDLATQDPRLKLIDNPQKIQSYGLNLIMQKATGDIFLIADAHSHYAPDYVEQCVDALLGSGALNVGGAQRFVARKPFQSAVALASRSVLGSGGAKYRNPTYDGFGDTVYLGCCWREVFSHLGGFNVDAVTNQDAEFNLRLQNFFGQGFQLSKHHQQFVQNFNTESGKAVYLSSKIKVWYFPRQSWKALFKQYFKYGRGRYLTSIKHSKDVQLRGKLPFIVLSSFCALACLSLVIPMLRWLIAAIVVIGILLLCIESIRVNWKFRHRFTTEIWRGNSKQVPSIFFRFLYCVVVFATMPIAHFSGYGYQLLRHKIFQHKGW